jgi:MFS family permease
MKRDLLFIVLALVTWGVGEGMFLLFTPLYLQEMGASSLQIGAILGLVGAFMMVAHLPSGYLADRIGRRPLLWTAWLMGLAAAWIMALAPNLTVFVAGNALYGLTSFVIAPLNSYITAARGNWSVGRAITLISATYNTGAILGPLLGGWIAQRSGLQSNFQIAATIFFFSTASILFIRKQPVEKIPDGESRARFIELWQGRMPRFLLVLFVVMFGMMLPQPFSQNYLQNQRGLDMAQIGLLLSLRSLGIVVLNLGLGHLNARRGFLLAQVGMLMFTFLLWRGESLLWFAGGYFLLGSYQTARALANAQGRTLVKPANMGMAYGMIEMTMAMAAFLAPPVAGQLYNIDPSLIYSISLGLIGAGIAVMIFLSPLRSADLT